MPAAIAFLRELVGVPSSGEQLRGKRRFRAFEPPDPRRELPIHAHLLAAHGVSPGSEAAYREWLRFSMEYRDDERLGSAARSGANRAAGLVTRLREWIYELQQASTTSGRRRTIVTMIDRLDAALESVEDDNAVRIEVAEHIRLVARSRVPEILELLVAARPDRAQRLRDSLAPWFFPGLLVVFLAGVRRPALAGKIQRAELEHRSATKAIAAWREAGSGGPDKTVVVALSELLSRVDLKCAEGSFATQYRRWRRYHPRDEEIERRDLWTRLGVILEAVGYCEDGAAIEPELDEHWRALVRASSPNPRAR